jgi:hypothetical protein
MEELEEQQLSCDTGPPANSERRLLWAVLLDAVHCYRHNRPSSASVSMRRAWHRECRWFQSNDRSSPFTFESICDALGLDPDYVRRLVRSTDDRWRSRLQRKPTGD